MLEKLDDSGTKWVYSVLVQGGGVGLSGLT